MQVGGDGNLEAKAVATTVEISHDAWVFPWVFNPRITTNISIKSMIARWRRGRDSNPRYRSRYTPLAGARLRPLGHLSGGALIGASTFGIKRFSCDFPLFPKKSRLRFRAEKGANAGTAAHVPLAGALQDGRFSACRRHKFGAETGSDEPPASEAAGPGKQAHGRAPRQNRDFSAG